MDGLAAALAAISVISSFWSGQRLLAARRAAKLRLFMGVPADDKPRRAPGDPALEGWSRRFARNPAGARLERWAAIHHPGVPFSDILAVALAGLIGGGLLGALLFRRAWLAAALALITPVVTERVFARVQGSRTSRIEKQLPEALALQAGALRAGQSLIRSVRIVQGGTKAPLGEELARMLREVDLGRPLDQALEEMAARTASRDLDLWVTSMLVHRQTGGNLAGVIESLSARILQRLHFRSEVRAMTAQGRLSGLVVAVAPLAFFLLLSLGSRQQMQVVYSTPAGWGLLAVGLTMNGLGLLWIRRVLRIKP